MQGSLKHALAFGALLAVPTVSTAASVRVQNANLDLATNTVFVKGVTDAIVAGTPVYLFNAETGALMASDLDGNKQVSLRAVVPANEKAPCTVVIRAGAPDALDAVTGVTQVRHASSCTAQLLQLAGQVVDEPIPFATVTVTLNGVSYTTVADENGFYTLDIATATVSELVTIEATKKMASGETIDFVSLAGSFSKLLADADGGVLSSDTSQKVNVTNVTTAEYVLLVEANGGTAPTTVEELQQAETRVDATELLQLAAVIKLIVDEGYDLPAGYTTVLDFLQDPDPAVVDSFIASVAAQDPDALDQAIGEILASNGLVAGYQVDQVPGRYFVTFRAEPGFLARSGDVLEFSAVRPDGCATLGAGCAGYLMTRDVTGEPVGVPTQWYIENGVLEVAMMAPTSLSRIADPVEFQGRFPSAVMTDGTPLAACGATDILNFEESIVGYAFTRFNDGQTVDGLSRRADISYTSFQPVFCQSTQGFKTVANLFSSITDNILARDSGSIAPRRFVRANAATGAADEVIADGQWALQVYANLYLQLSTGQRVTQRSIFADNVSLQADGSAGGAIASELGVSPASWAIDAVTGELVVSYSDGWVQRVILTDALDSDEDGAVDQYGAFSVFTGPQGQRFASSDPAFKRDTALAIDAGSVQNPSGKYWQTVVNAWLPGAWESDPVTGLRRLTLNSQFFGFRAAPVGGGFRGSYSPADTNPNNPCGTTPLWFRTGFSGYAIEDVGTLNVVAMRYNAGNGRTRIWSVASTDTVQLPTSPATAQRRLNVIELDRLEAVSGSPHVFPPRVNFYREFTEPSIDRGLCAAGFAPQF